MEGERLGGLEVRDKVLEKRRGEEMEGFGNWKILEFEVLMSVLGGVGMIFSFDVY